MRNYRFRLQPVMDVRVIQRDIQAGEVARLMGEKEEQVKKLGLYQQKWEKSCEPALRLRPEELLHTQYYREQLQFNLQTESEILREKEHLVHQAQKKLVEAEVDCRSLDLLRKKGKGIFRREALREEQYILDEAGMSNYTRMRENL